MLLTLALLAYSGPAIPDSTFKLEQCSIPGLEQPARCGTYWVWEDRDRKAGRRIGLKVIILPSRSATPKPDPFWYVSPGGPGSTNTPAARGIAANAWWRDDRDVVIVDLRGTGGDNQLDCALWGSDERPDKYLMPLFPPAAVRACRDSLSKRADLRYYTSMLAVDDLDEVRAALGYRQVNLWGASWGTRVVFMWLRRHPASVRSAIIEGVAPTALKNPLTHARSAQMALDTIFAACDAQASCHAAFPALRQEFATVLERLKRAPARVAIHGAAGADTVTLTWQQFAEALRVMTYNAGRDARVPLFIHQAFQGDLSSFAEAGIQSNRALRNFLRFGFLLSVTCTEDVPRITQAEIGPETAGTYLGDSRVREQMRACADWPHFPLDAHYGDPVRSNVPVFMLSGDRDPVSPSHFAAEALKSLPNGFHVVAPGGHVPGGPCVVAMERAFLEAASGKAVDTSCVATMTLPAFVTN